MIRAIRFRTEGETVVLQVQIVKKYTYDDVSTWRDARVEDLLEVAEFCKTDMYQAINSQISRLRDDIFNRLAPREPYYTDEELNHMDALNQHQERNE